MKKPLLVIRFAAAVLGKSIQNGVNHLGLAIRKNPREWMSLAVMIPIYFYIILLYIARYQLKSPSSDFATIYLFTKDLFSDEYMYWSIQPAPNFFPEGLFFLPAFGIIDSVPMAFHAYFILQNIAFLLVVFYLFRRLDCGWNRLTQFNLSLVTNGLMYLTVFQSPISSQLYYPCIHTGLILSTIGLAGLFLKIRSMPKKTQYFFWVGLIVTFTSFSDRLFILAVVITYFVIITIFTIYDYFGRKEWEKISLAFLFGLAGSQILLNRLDESLSLSFIDYMPNIYKNRVIQSYKMLLHIVDQLYKPVLFDYLRIFLILSVAIVLCLMVRRWYRRFFNTVVSINGESRVPDVIFIVISFATIIIGNAAVCVMTAFLRKLSSDRYFTSLAILPITAICIVLFKVISTGLLRYRRILLPITVVVLFAISIMSSTEGSFFDIHSSAVSDFFNHISEDNTPRYIRELVKLAKKRNLKFGLSLDYWSTKPVTMYTKRRLIVNEVVAERSKRSKPALNIRLTNAFYFFRIDKAHNSISIPKYKFALVKPSQKEESISIFGTPKTIEEIDGYQVFIYPKGIKGVSKQLLKMSKELKLKERGLRLKRRTF